MTSELHPNIVWLLGEQLHERLEFERLHPDAAPSRLLAAIQSSQRVHNHWVDQIHLFCSVLTNPAEAPRKVALDLHPSAAGFDLELGSVLAEITGAVRLSQLGAKRFEILFPSEEPGVKTPDFRCVWEGRETAVEAKNLRELRCVEHAMMGLFREAERRSPERFNFQLIVRRSGRNWLNDEEERELAGLVDQLPQVPRDAGEITQCLSSGVEVVFEIRAGAGCVAQDVISLADLGSDHGLGEGLGLKASRVAVDAMKQLHDPQVRDVQRRVVVMRWEIPWWAIPLPSTLQWSLLEALRKALAKETRSTELLIHSELGFEFHCKLPFVEADDPT